MHRRKVVIDIVLLILALAAWSAGPVRADETPGDLTREEISKSPGGAAGGDPGAGRMASLLDQAARESGAVSAPIFDFRREILTDKIAHYSFKVRFGTGRYDVLRMHRIVKESTPFGPIRAKDGILLMHGDILGIEGAFLGNRSVPGIPADHSFPIFLSKNGIDVWGVDMGWVLVPPEETDFLYAKDWGYAKELAQMDLALSIARSGRALTGSGSGKIFALGWSNGAAKLYAYASAEAQIPQARRQVRGYIPADIYFKIANEPMRQACCADYDYFVARYQAGDYTDTTGSFFIFLGELAETDPTGDSPVFPGMTNVTAALMFGTIPFGWPYVPYYHLVAGVFDAAGVATGLQYASVPYFLHWLRGAAPYEPLQIEYEPNTVCCENMDAPWDDHLAEITAPMLIIMAGGGFLVPGAEMVNFLPSADVKTLFVQLHPPEEAALDFAHVDLWIANNAEDLVWRPILNWMKGH